MQIAMGTFAVASLLCGLAQTIGQLIAARAVQGIGGGAIQALAFAIVGDVLPPRVRGKYVGYFTLAFAGAALLGPLGLTNTRSLVLIGIALVVLTLFVFQERRASEPMIPLRLFRNRVVLTCAMLGAMAGAVSFGASNYMSVFFQDALFVPPTEAGLRTMPLMVGVVASSTAAGRMISARGYYKRFPVAGSIMATIALSLSSILVFNRLTYLFFIPVLLLMGLGFGSVYTTTSIATQNACEIRDMGAATATIMFFRTLGGSIMLAISGTVLNKTVRSEIPSRTGLSADEGVALIREPEKIAALPANLRNAVVDSISLGVGRIQLLSALCMLIGIGWALAMPELPLRSRAGLTDVLKNE